VVEDIYKDSAAQVAAHMEVDLMEAVTEEVAAAKAVMEDIEVDLVADHKEVDLVAAYKEVDLVAAHKEVDLVAVVLTHTEVDSE
jgi:hypothetical protein